MHINKHFLFVVGFPALAILAIVFFGIMLTEPKGGAVVSPNGDNTRIMMGDELPAVNDTPAAPPTGVGSAKLGADTFTGTLTKVDTGCFADGECYVEVDGNHVTAIMGWSKETVGTVQGVEGFGDLENYIGEQVEVYAQRLAPGNYTLYGSEGFYIRVGGAALVDPMPPQTSPGSAGGGAPGFPGIAVDEPYPGVPRPEPTGGCIVGGCSSQLCVDESMGDMASTCEWREEYACYQGATCGRQVDGQCGWTETPELTECRNAASTESPSFIVQ